MSQGKVLVLAYFFGELFLDYEMGDSDFHWLNGFALFVFFDFHAVFSGILIFLELVQSFIDSSEVVEYLTEVICLH